MNSGQFSYLSWVIIVTGLNGRTSQDAAFAVPLDKGGVFTISDGVGGKPNGTLAASAAAEFAAKQSALQLDVSLPMIIEETQRHLVELAKGNPELDDMATTLTILRIRDGIVELGHVGDCRVYHLRANGLIQLTEDQTELQRLLANGVLSRGMAARFRRRNVLWSALGPKSTFEVFSSSATLEKGDRLLMLTDGAYAKIPKVQMRDLSVTTPDTAQFSLALQNEIEALRPNDDYSVTTIDVGSG